MEISYELDRTIAHYMSLMNTIFFSPKRQYEIIIIFNCYSKFIRTYTKRDYIPLVSTVFMSKFFRSVKSRHVTIYVQTKMQPYFISYDPSFIRGDSVMSIKALLTENL
jgi:hypothetical protein